MDERLPITESRIAAARLVIVSLAELPAEDTGVPAAAPIPISAAAAALPSACAGCAAAPQVSVDLYFFLLCAAVAPIPIQIPISELITCGAGKWNGVAPSFVGKEILETAGGEKGSRKYGAFPEGSHHAFSSGSLLVRLGGGGHTVLL